MANNKLGQYLFYICLLYSGSAVCMMDSSHSSEETSSESESESESESDSDESNSPSFWQVYPLNADSTETYRAIRSSLSPASVPADSPALFNGENATRLNIPGERSRVFVAALGIAPDLLNEQNGAVDIPSGLELSSNALPGFSWFHIGRALMAIGQLECNYGVNPALDGFIRRYRHLSQDYRIGGSIDLIGISHNQQLMEAGIAVSDIVDWRAIFYPLHRFYNAYLRQLPPVNINIDSVIYMLAFLAILFGYNSQ